MLLYIDPNRLLPEWATSLASLAVECHNFECECGECDRKESMIHILMAFLIWHRAMERAIAIHLLVSGWIIYSLRWQNTEHTFQPQRKHCQANKRIRNTSKNWCETKQLDVMSNDLCVNVRLILWVRIFCVLIHVTHAFSCTYIHISHIISNEFHTPFGNIVRLNHKQYFESHAGRVIRLIKMFSLEFTDSVTENFCTLLLWWVRNIRKCLGLQRLNNRRPTICTCGN